MTKIGLEIHCQLTNLQSKLFCPCKANYREFGINENICPICMGLPGSLPRLNQEAVKKATMIAMALNCSTPDKIAFFRKNYFYPDLPKNFQITQLNIYGDTSIGGTGSIMVGDKKINITRIQLEEDPGRLIYEGSSSKNLITLVDYNRAGTPLVEIVTEPDFENPKQVREFLNILSDLLENLGVSDPGLEGAMRADANVSIEGGKKVEIKNIGSFHDLEKATIFEITRQESLHSRDIEIAQETRHWDDKRKITVSSRSKEEESDYRYFLEGDIPWVLIDSETKEKIENEMPTSMEDQQRHYVEQLQMQPQVAHVISTSRTDAKFFGNCLATCSPEYSQSIGVSTQQHTTQHTHTHLPPTNTTYSNATIVRSNELSNMMTTDMKSYSNYDQIKLDKNFEKDIGKLIDDLSEKKITRNSAKSILSEMFEKKTPYSELFSELSLEISTDESELLEIIKQVISEESKAVEEAKSNPQTINYLVGKVMQKTKGQADPAQTLDLLKKQIG
ncbi:MAG: Asp-tRNA(Asn)/Glu-tRNA(Gln) amidotransferase subunit GatB [Thaumarchaeota archaeon]|nr:Asp-tRNA(Asn)/Glu-tRNA(Gln) amidotransferase subunit GatB [Nitrososphaerota archaeon]